MCMYPVEKTSMTKDAYYCIQASGALPKAHNIQNISLFQYISVEQTITKIGLGSYTRLQTCIKARRTWQTVALDGFYGMRRGERLFVRRLGPETCHQINIDRRIVLTEGFPSCPCQRQPSSSS